MRYNNQDLIDCGEQMLGVEGFGGCTIAEYRQYLMRILGEIDRICRKNEIKYFLMYGTLIGAVRHNGFIPWDDDADIVMTRADFNKFRECCKKELGDEFDLVSYMDDSNYGYTFPKLRMKNTTYIIRSEVSRHGRSAGFFVDIILLDYLSESKVKAFIQKRALMALHRLVSPGFFQNAKGLRFAEDVLVGASKLLLGRKRSLKLAEKILSSAKPEKCSSLIAEILIPTVNYYYIYDKRHFERSIDVEFEGKLLPIPSKALSFLNEMYFRTAKATNSLLEHPYEDENEAIRTKNIWHYNSIMFIPAERERNRHLEVVFDCEHGSSYYDSVYFDLFDKKKNDRCAVKERKCREKSRKALGRMNWNETIARGSCSHQRLEEYLNRVMENKEAKKLSVKEAVEIADNLVKLGAANLHLLTEAQRVFCIEVMLKTSRLGYVLAYLQRFEADYPETNVSELREDLDVQLTAYYEFFQNKEEVVNEYRKRKMENHLSEIVDAVWLYKNGDYEKAQKALEECLETDKSSFWAHYYLGDLYLYHKKEVATAEKMYRCALDDTGFMPLLQKALDRIKECRVAGDGCC